MEQLAVAFNLFFVGLAYGSSVCLFSCGAILSPLLLSRFGGADSRVSVMLFCGGRVFSYTAIALASAFFGSVASSFAKSGTSVQIAAGVITMSVALYSLYRTNFKKRCENSCHGGFFKGSLFAVGALSPAILCPPVLSLITVSVAADSLFGALVYGVSFGVGASLLTFLLYGAFLGEVAKELLKVFSAHRRLIENLAGAALLCVGGAIASGTISI